MKSLAMLFAERVSSDRGLNTIERVMDEVVVHAPFPIHNDLWVYFEIAADEGEAGRPVHLRLELIDPEGRAHVAGEGDPIFPLSQHPEMPAVWAPKFHVAFPLARAGRHLVRLTIDDQVVAERPLLVTQEAWL